MLTSTQIDAGTLRLTEDKLKPVDVDSLVSVFRMFLADLEARYGYDLRGSLESLDDSLDAYKKAAQVAACLIKMEELNFGVASLTGELNYKEKDEYFQYVVIAFSKIYTIPIEWSQYEWKKRQGKRTSSTIFTERVP